MAAKRGTTNNHSRLEDAISQLTQSQAQLTQSQAVLVQNQAALVQTQAEFVQNQAAFNARLAEMDRVNAERSARIDNCFAHLEAQMAEVIRVLNEHSRILEHLPEAVREKIGFKTQPTKE